QLARLVDSGVPVKDAASALGIARQRCYAILRAMGRPVGKPRRARRTADSGVVGSVFGSTGSVDRAAKAAGVSHSVARRILVEAGLVGADRTPRGKAEAKTRLLVLLAAGWSVARAAREVGVNERTARDWRDGVRKTSNGNRVHPDGTVVDYTSGTRYTSAVTKIDNAAISDRYLSLADRLAIADGLLTRQSFTQIAARIGKHKSTVSREVAAHRVDGLYLPYQADKTAAARRARPKRAKLVVDHALRDAVAQGLAQRYSPEQISYRLRKDFPDDESMWVSHETIYQALYFQARGGLKREVAQALRTGRTRRKPHRAPGQRTHRFVDEMIMISDRPAEVDDRAVPGHWEGDLITGEHNKSAIATLVERSTRYTMLVHLPGGHDAESVRDGLITTISTLP
ncbi:IS30 family transposase, partial [Nocardia sp. NPDC051463]|uniref:IS30 family transposase n=1 Tax=Nocardia sp. NPDC051463 TaxID=3154845 RepID=UPI0034502545